MMDLFTRGWRDACPAVGTRACLTLHATELVQHQHACAGTPATAKQVLGSCSYCHPVLPVQKRPLQLPAADMPPRLHLRSGSLGTASPACYSHSQPVQTGVSKYTPSHRTWSGCCQTAPPRTAVLPSLLLLLHRYDQRTAGYRAGWNPVRSPRAAASQKIHPAGRQWLWGRREGGQSLQLSRQHEFLACAAAST